MAVGPSPAASGRALAGGATPGGWPSGPRVGRACGKVILLGEHAVVHGVAALAVGIDRGVRAVATPIAAGACSLEVAAWRLAVVEGDCSTEVARAFSAIVDAARAQGLGSHASDGERGMTGREREEEVGRESSPSLRSLSPILPVPSLCPEREHKRCREIWEGAPSSTGGCVRVELDVALPPGGGLGCSAAMGVAIARALVPGSTPDGAADLAMAWERVFHGNPSGIDAVVAARGGSVLFRRGHPTQTVALGVPLTVCVGDTGVGSSTRTMVERVARLRDRDPSRFDEVMTSVASLVAGARRAVEAGDLARLGGLMNRNQSILRDMDLSTPAIDQLCAAALTAGAHGAKLTGGGGGGCVVALASDAGAAERVVAAWRGAGFEGFVARVTQQGDDT